MKKIFSFILVLVLTLSCFVFSASAETPPASPASANRNFILTTHYGYYEVPYNTVVGYGNETSGYNVKATQSCLKTMYEEYGINCYPGDIDSLFGPDTYNAIYNFQVAENLSADGRAGNQTFGKFETML